MPKVRRSDVILRLSWVLCHPARRASSGCAEAVEPGVTAEAEERFARSVSWIPGADGAPLVDVELGWLAERLVVELGCADDGAIRRD